MLDGAVEAEVAEAGVAAVPFMSVVSIESSLMCMRREWFARAAGDGCRPGTSTIAEAGEGGRTLYGGSAAPRDGTPAAAAAVNTGGGGI